MITNDSLLSRSGRTHRHEDQRTAVQVLNTDLSIALPVEQFLNYKESPAGNRVAKATRRKYRRTLSHLAAYLACKQGVVNLSHVRSWMLDEWMNTWELKTYDGRAKLEAGGRYSYGWNNWVVQTRAFFKWCVRREFISKDPSIDFKVPGDVGHEQTMPYTDAEIDAILAAVDKVRVQGYNEFRRREPQPWPSDMRTRMRVFIQVMLWTGLAIRDTTMLERDALQDGSRLFLRRTKTGGEVFAKLPPQVADELRAVKNGENYFFWNGTCAIETAVGRNDQNLRRVFRVAGVKDARSHRFRDTFAIRLFQAGMETPDVAKLLGNTERIVEKHYKAWIPKLQQQLEQRLEAAWERMPGFRPSAAAV